MRAKIPDRTCVLITRVCAIITLRCISFFERATMTQCLGKTVETWSSVNGGRPTVKESEVMSQGRLFQTLGPATTNDRSLKTDSEGVGSDVARETVPDPGTSNNKRPVPEDRQ